MTRRIFAFVLAAVMLLSVIPVHAADLEPTFVVDTVTAAAGETVEVTIRLENNPGVTSLKLYMEYDSALTLTGVSHNPDLGTNFLVSPEGKYPVYLNWYDGLKDVSGDWVFVTLTFSVAEDAAEGTYPVSITYDPNDVFDANEDNVHFAIQNGGVTVEPANVSVTGVALDQTSLSLTEGQTAQLTATVTPANATNPNVSFNSSDPEVASVDGSGKVTAHKEGTATITVTTADGSLTATCTVTVSCAHGSKTEVPSKSADCVTAGNYLYYVCDTCAQAFKADGVTKTTVEAETIPATGHDLTPVAAVDAKCEQEGNLAYYTCTCGAWFSDAAGKQPITDKGSVILEKLGHSFTNYVTDNNATCVEDGTETAKCDRCDATDTVKKVGSATGHTMGEWYETKALTCTDNGTEQRDCANCDHFETRETEAKGHSYTDVVTAPTCTEQGYTTHTCTCGDSFVDTYTAALGHDYGQWYETKAPSYTEEGEERRDCSRCDEYQTRKVAALQHQYSETIVAPTCTEQGYTIHHCAECGDKYIDTYVNALGHSFTNYTSNGDAVCTTDGTKTAKCDRCDATDTVTDVGSATGHSMGEWQVTKAPTCTEKGTEQRDCANCDHYETREIDAKGHSYTDVVTAPTCTEKGYTTHTCACGESYVDSYVSAKGHAMGDWKEIKAPTCTEKGTEQRDCADCEYFETRETEAKGHSYTDVITAPTCTEKGYTTHTCACGESYVDSYVSARGHAMGDWYETKAPTCTEKGTEQRDCANCDHYETREIDAKGHSYTDVVTAPTCTEKGYTTHTCACGDSFADSYVSAKGHAMGDWKEIKAPTCTEKGTEQRDCANCDHYETRQIDAKGHSYTDVVTAPTCTEQGYTTHTCACGDSYVDTYTTALGHDYGDWYETKAPSYTDEGEERRDCSRCDEYQTRKIAALQHEYSETIVAPTCTEQGYTIHHCAECGDEYIDTYINALGHSFSSYTSNGDASCTVDGTKTAKCDRCDATDTVTDVGSATGHAMGDWEEIKAPTCTEAGMERQNCANCDHFETREIAAKGHEYTAAVTAPTCTGQGYTTHTCACGDSYVDSYVDALGHSWDEGVVTKEPTEKEEGVRTYTCGTCSETKTESIPVLDHTHKFSPVVTAPTCTEEGYTTFLCTCGESYVSQRTDALGHSWSEWEETKAPNYLEFGERTHTCIRCDAYETEEINNNPFTDVGDGNRFKTQILWAYYEGITSGKTATTFAPNSEVTRAQFVTFLWRSAGSPEPKSQENPFTDVTSGNRFLQAILWAYHEGITSGTTATTFSPNNTCTRGQVVMFLYRYAGSPEVTDVENPFEDVSTGNRFYNAIMWAVDEGITSGKTATTFEINGACTRAQVVTFLYRYLRS